MIPLRAHCSRCRAGRVSDPVTSSSSTAPLRLGTRRSRLARTQSALIAEALTVATGRTVELVDVSTYGDVNRGPLAQIGGTGVFVSALREALSSGEVDFAVHSLKDLPTTPADGISLAAIPSRGDARDALVARDGLTLGELPAGARIGTGSPRRIAQIHALGLGMEMVDIRGNIDSRIGRVEDGSLDGVLLAAAGLARIGRLTEVTEMLDPIQMLPAAGQGALAVECRASDPDLAALLGLLDHQPTRACVTAERAMLAALEAGCASPVGALAEYAEGDEGPELYLRGVRASVDGSDSFRHSLTGAVDDSEGLGRRLAALLLDD